MTKSDDKRVPALRFKGFTDEWEQRKLGEVSTFINGRAYKQSELLNSGKYKVLRVGNFYTNDSWYYSNLELADKYYIKKGDLIYTWSATFGPHIWDGEKVIYHYHIWKIKLSKYLDKNFTLQILEADKAKLLSNTNGSTMIHVTKNNMENKVISIPNIKEQKKIGECLMKFDSLIELQQRKEKQLKLLKTAMLQTLFTKKNVPQLRFKGFTDTWKQRKLGEVTKIVSGGTPSTNISKYWNGNINWYSPTEIGNQTFVNSSKKKITELGLKESSAKLLPGKKTILFTSRAGIGDMAIMNTDGSTNQGFQSWVVKPHITDIYFLYSLGSKLKKQALRKASGSTFLEISNSEVKKLTLYLPGFKEQTIIGKIIELIDKLITFQQGKTNKLESLKQFLLQNMFI